MTNAHKAIAWVCIFSMLFMGCYSSTVVTSDTPQLDGKELVFKLLWLREGTNRNIYNHDEAYVISKQHHRIDNGYEVTGNLVNPENRAGKDFSGVLYDDQIKEVAIREYDGILTGVVIGGVLLVVIVAIAVFADNFKYGHH